MKKLSPEIIEIIKNSQELIEENNFSKLYEKIYKVSTGFEDISNFTLNLYNVGIDPLKYMNSIPKHFLAGTNITSFNIPNNIIEIGESAFGYTELESIKIPKNVKTINRSCFEECKNLKDIDLGNIEYISTYIFDNCTSLKSIKIPGTVEYLGRNIFYGCKNLKHIYYDDIANKWLNLNDGNILKGIYSEDEDRPKNLIIHCNDDEFEFDVED